VTFGAEHWRLFTPKPRLEEEQCNKEQCKPSPITSQHSLSFCKFLASCFDSLVTKMATAAVEYGQDVSETNYYEQDMQYENMGYNDDVNYSYDDQQMYDYGNNQDDMYGYDSQDYGYGDQSDPPNSSEPVDMGYEEDCSPPPEPEKPEPKARRPRRRCSVTKYSLEESAQSGSPEAEMVKNLHAAEMLQKFRQGL
jgi:hypothetical protein